MMNIIEIDHVSYSYEDTPVLHDMQFSVMERDFVGLVGANGAGKTTLLKLIVGLLKPTSGEVRLFGHSTAKFRDWDKIGYVPQKNQFNPLFPATVEEIVLTGLYSNKTVHRRVTREQQQKCHDALEALGVQNLLQKRIGQLSGGQQQRVFLARALINNPSLLILDEPTIGIDAQTQNEFFYLIRHMHEHHNITFLMVTHDMEMVRSHIGEQPIQSLEMLHFYVKKADPTKACSHRDLTHSLKEMRLPIV
jgi:zinc transport system ATP-binding protein